VDIALPRPIDHRAINGTCARLCLKGYLAIFDDALACLHQQYDVDLALGDIAQVRRCDVSDIAQAQLDLTAPAYKVLPRSGTLDIQVVLVPSAKKRTLGRLPQLLKEEEGEGKPTASADFGVFLVCYRDVQLRLTLSPSLLGKSLRESIVQPFLKEYAKRTGVLLDADALGPLSVDGLETSDAMTASSFALGNAVRVELALKEGQETA
jgi:hypothetical protein